MDDRKTSLSLHDFCRRFGADAASIASPLREGSVVVYCGNAQQVSEGFTNPNREDD
jgi:hypothetical protein